MSGTTTQPAVTTRMRRFTIGVAAIAAMPMVFIAAAPAAHAQSGQTYVCDAHSNGGYDSYCYDDNGDGVTDRWHFDRNGNGFFETEEDDRDYNGQADIEYTDTDENGDWDVIREDTNGDGHYDAQYTRHGNQWTGVA